MCIIYIGHNSIIYIIYTFIQDIYLQYILLFENTRPLKQVKNISPGRPYDQLPHLTPAELPWITPVILKMVA